VSDEAEPEGASPETPTAGPYEAVHAYHRADAGDASNGDGGTATPARYATTAAEYGFDGVVVRTRAAEYDAAELAERYGIDVVRGIEIDAPDPQAASGAVGTHRSECTVLTVRGGTPALNRFAVEQDRVDVLSRPFAGTGDVNHVVVQAAVDHGVRLEFDLGPVLRADGGTRVRHLRKLRKLRELVTYYDAPYVVSANPGSQLQVRAPRELAALGETIGFEAGAIAQGLAEWGRIAGRTRERRSEAFISPGVKRGRYDQ
jgi:ribonuclease P/MRP protein subunit RPP1